MKLQNALVALGAALFLASCNVEKADGPIISETRDLPAFDRLVVNTPGRVEVVIGSDTKAEITVEESVLALLKTEVSGGRLMIDFSKSVRDVENLVIRVTVPSLSRIDLNGSGDVVCEGLLKGAMLDLNGTGSGSIELKKVDFGSIEATSSGSGDVSISGAAIEISGFVFGSGDLLALETKTENARVENSGSGDALVAAASHLRAKLTGSGDISYRGQPTIDEAAITGSGKLIKID